MTFDIAIVNARIVVPNVGIVNTNIAIKNGKIAEFTPDEVQSDKRIDAEGLYALPGIIDPHVHYGVYTSIDKAAKSESGSAAIGGITTMMRMLRLYGSYEEKLKAHLNASVRSHIVDYAYHASILLPEHVKEINYCINNATDVFVSWLPLYHDMGLIGAWFGSLYYGFPAVIMSPLHFLARPSRWLWAIHRHRGTIGASPNFGYELCLGKVADEDIKGLDLSSWRLALNGAEPVSPDTVQAFCGRFAPYGFRAEALMPVYGLAESTVGLAIPRPVGRQH